MEVGNMKNIVLLKNLPSNIVDEAIVILKSNKYSKKLEYVDKKSNKEYSGKGIQKDYIVKEAENVINNYVSKIENKNNKFLDIEKKYKKLKIYSIIITLILCISVVKSIF